MHYFSLEAWPSAAEKKKKSNLFGRQKFVILGFVFCEEFDYLLQLREFSVVKTLINKTTYHQSWPSSSWVLPLLNFRAYRCPDSGSRGDGMVLKLPEYSSLSIMVNGAGKEQSRKAFFSTL